MIWSDECGFNVGGLSSSGRTWVTRMAGEEDLEDCLVPKFPKLKTIMASTIGVFSHNIIILTT